MTKEERLDHVKKGLGITGNFQNDTLSEYIDDIMAFIKAAGVSPAVAESEEAIGCIIRGVADMWNYGKDASLSQYFIRRMIQLKRVGDPNV